MLRATVVNVLTYFAWRPRDTPLGLHLLMSACISFVS